MPGRRAARAGWGYVDAGPRALDAGPRALDAGPRELMQGCARFSSHRSRWMQGCASCVALH